MAENQVRPAGAQLAKQPSVFTLKQSFPVWFKQFRNYAELLQVQVNQRYRTLLSFLDAESFTIVENLALNDEQRADVFQAASYQLIKNALTQRESRIPPGYELKYRKQRENESIEKYASELECLALEAFPGDANIRQNRTLIESFISGIRNDELAIKLLEENFQNLGQAIERAVHYYQALQTRRFIKTESDFRPALEKVYNVSTSSETHDTTNKEAKPAEKVNAVNASETQSSAPKQLTNNANASVISPGTQGIQFPGIGHYNQLYTPLPNNPSWTNQQYFNQPSTRYPSAPTNHSLYFNQPVPGSNWQQYAPWTGIHQQPLNNKSRAQYPARRSRANVVCYHCGKIGHYKNECYSLLRMQSNSNQDQPAAIIKCSYCGKSGHQSHNCWHLKRKNEQPQNQTVDLNPFRPT